MHRIFFAKQCNENDLCEKDYNTIELNIVGKNKIIKDIECYNNTYCGKRCVVSLPRGGIADKIGNNYEIYVVIKELLRLFNYNDSVGYVQYEEIKEDNGVDCIIGNKDNCVEYVQCKSSHGNDGKWNPSSLTSIINKWKSSFDDQSIRFRIVSPLISPELEEVKLKINDYNNNSFSRGTKKLINDIKINIGDNENVDIDSIISILNRVEIESLPYSALEDIIISKLELYFKGDPKLNLRMLTGELLSGRYYGKKLYLLEFNNILKTLNIKYRDLSNDKTLLAQIEIINDRYKKEYNKIDDKLILNSDLKSIISKVYDNEISIIYGHAGVGKSGVCLQLIQYCKDNQLPYIAIELDIYKFRDNLAKWSENLELPDNIVYCLNDVSSGKDSLIIMDQADYIHSFDSDYKIAKEICLDIIKKVNNINKSKLSIENKCNMHIVFISREYDFKNDSIISGIYKDKLDKTNYAEIEIKKLNDKDVQCIIGEEYCQLNNNTKELLRTFNNIYIYKKLKNKHKNYLSTNDLIQQWCMQINEEINLQDGDVNIVQEIYSEIKNQYLYNKMYYIDKQELKHNCNKELNYLLSTGIIVDREGKISFGHQTILDYFISKDLYNVLKKDNVNVIKELERIGVDKLKNRYLLVLVLQDIVSSSTDRFVQVADEILNSKSKLHFFVKTVILEILAMHSLNKNDRINNYIKSKVKDRNWHKHFINVVVPSNYEYIYSLLEDGYLEKMFDNKKTAKDAIMLLASISDKLDEKFDDIIIKNVFKYHDLIDEWRWVFVKDINEDSDDLFKIRMDYYNKYPEYLYTINFKNLFKSGSVRIIDIIELLFTGRKRIREVYFCDLFDEYDGLGWHFYETNYRIVINNLLKYVPTQLPQFVGLSNWCATCLHSENTERVLVEMLKRSAAFMFRQDYELFYDTFNEFFKSKNDIFNEIMLYAFIENVGYNNKRVIDIVVDNFDSIIFSQTYNGNDKLSLMKKLISSISKSCDQESFDRLENSIMKYKDREMIERKKQVSKKRRFNMPVVGYLQKELLSFMDKNRLKTNTLKFINELKRKKLPEGRFSGTDFQSGFTQSPLSGKNISIDSWFNIIHEHRTKQNNIKFVKGQFVDSSPLQLSYDFENFVTKNTNESINRFYNIKDYSKINCCYISAFLRAIKNRDKELNANYQKVFAIIKRSYQYLDDGSKCNTLEFIGKLMQTHFDTGMLKIIYKELHDGHWNYEINETTDYLMSGYNLPCCAAMRILISLYSIYNDKTNLDDKSNICNILDEFSKSNNYLKMFWIIPLCDLLYCRSKDKKYLDIILGIVMKDARFFAYNRMNKLLFKMYDYNKIRVIQLVIGASKTGSEYINEIISLFLIDLIYNEEYITSCIILKLSRSKKFIACLDKVFANNVENEKLKGKLLKFINCNIKTLMNEEMYLNRILYNKVIDVIKDKRIVLTMLQPKYFRKTIEEFIECVEASNINNCIDLVYKILKNYYSSKLYEEDYYSDEKVMSFLNRILSSDVIKNKNSYVKMLDLYDNIIKKNTTCCRFSYDEHKYF